MAISTINHPPKRSKPSTSGHAKRSADWRERHNVQRNAVTNELRNAVSEAKKRAIPTPRTTINASSAEEAVHTPKSKTKNLNGFAEWYAAYPRKVARANAEIATGQITTTDRAAALTAIRQQWTGRPCQCPARQNPLPRDLAQRPPLGRRSAARLESNCQAAGLSRDELIAIGNGAPPNDHPGNRENPGEPVDRLVQ